MKKNSLYCLLVFLSFLYTSNLTHAQKTTDVRQVIIANGGKFEGGPTFVDYVTMESYNLSTMAVNVFNTIYTQSVQDLIINGNHAYVSAQDSIIMYNIDNFQRVAAVKDSGVCKLAFYNDQLIVTKQWPVSKFFFEVLDGNNLGIIALVPGIPGDCEGAAVSDGFAYVAVDSGYQGVTGHLAIINATNWTLSNIVDLGFSAVGSHTIYPYGGYIFCINKTPYGGGNTGSITRYNPADGTFVTTVLNVTVGVGYGTNGNLIYLGINNGMGSYNMDTQQIVDTTIFTYFGGTGNVEIHSAAVDPVNQKFYTNFGDRATFGFGIVYSFTGDSLTSYTDGINPDACAIDFRTPTGITNNMKEEDIQLYPNPVNNYISLVSGSNFLLKEVTIYDPAGRTILSRPVNETEKNFRINFSDYPSGIYMISLKSDQGTKVKKFVKR